jgi:hypothetical protein
VGGGAHTHALVRDGGGGDEGGEAVVGEEQPAELRQVTHAGWPRGELVAREIEIDETRHELGVDMHLGK